MGVDALALVQADGSAVMITEEVDEGLVLGLLVAVQGRQGRQLLIINIIIILPSSFSLSFYHHHKYAKFTNQFSNNQLD